jgi:hypothetical protein
MSMLRFLWYYLWIAPYVLLVWVSVLMVRRRLYRDFPLFVCFAISDVVVNAALFSLFCLNNELYYFVYVIGTGLSVSLRFGVIHEVFQSVFGDSVALKKLATVIFRWATALLLLAAIVVAVHTAGSGASRLTASIRVTSKIVGIVQCGLVLLLLLFSRYFHLAWRSYAFGIALGLGIYASVGFVTAAIASQFGNSMTAVFDLIEMGTFHCSVLIWLFYLLIPEPAPKQVENVNLEDVRTWNRELERLLQQ